MSVQYHFRLYGDGEKKLIARCLIKTPHSREHKEDLKIESLGFRIDNVEFRRHVFIHGETKLSILLSENTFLKVTEPCGLKLVFNQWDWTNIETGNAKVGHTVDDPRSWGFTLTVRLPSQYTLVVGTQSKEIKWSKFI